MTTDSGPQPGRMLEPRARQATAIAGHLSEMFCSFQGEGLFVGERQVFVRMAGCAATCSWCDTVYSKVQTPRFVIHSNAHGEPKPWRPNPVSLGDVLADVGQFALANAPVKTVSITGGEPLEQPEFVSALARGLRAAGFRILLETAALHPDALPAVAEHADIIAADVKLPSATGMDHFGAHREFLRAACALGFDPARAGSRVLFVKVIVDARSTSAEIARAVDLVAEAGAKIPFVIQPESGALLGRHATREGREALLAMVEEAARTAAARIESVRVIPQTHKVLHVR